MLQKLDITRAETDVRLALYELGFADTIDAPLDHALSLRDDLGLDSLELVSLAETLSGLATGAPPLDGQALATVGDCVAFVHDARDSWLPTDTPYVLQGSIVIRRPVADVFGYIDRFRDWPERLAHVTAIEPEYDDGRFQAFRMHIEELTSRERYFVRSWRYVNREALILDFSQPKPPAGFAVHKGGWRFREIDPGRTALISYHGFSLEPEADGAEAVALIRKHIQAALTTWAKHGNS